MAARASVLLSLLFAASIALGDQVVLVDGRVFVGTVTVEDDAVRIDLPHGSVRFANSEVLRVEIKNTPESEFATRLSVVPKDDAISLYELAQWAGQNDLKRQATELLNQVIKIQPDHADARRQLGYIKVDGQWRLLDDADKIARSRLETGEKLDVLLAEVVPAMEEAASPQQKTSVKELRGLVQLRNRKFAEAADTFKELAAKAEGAPAVRWSAIAEILAANSDGMYVLAEPYPPSASLLNPAAAQLKAGPQSLADPLVLQAALRDKAKKEIDAGRKLMDAAQAAENSDPDSARARYAQAGQAFDKADAMVSDIARSYRVEIARRKIATLRKYVDGEAGKIDAMKGKLGQKDMTPQAYRTMVLQMLHLVDNVRDNLKAILDATKPFPREMVLEIKWAETDLRTMDAMKQVLAGEIEGDK